MLEIGTVLVRGGRIESVWPGRGPDPRDVRAEILEAAGRTLLPGFIDAWVLLPEDAAGQRRALASMLYCGVTGVGAASVRPEILASVAVSIEEGEWLGASVLAMGRPDPPAGPPLVALEWIRPGEGMPLLLNRSLTQQVLNPSYRAALAQQMRDWRDRPEPGEPGPLPDPPYSAAGLWMLPHGPALHRQLQLMAAGGLATGEILKQVTSGAAARFGKTNIGRIRPGADADLLLVDGNPLEDIAATERIVAVFSKGERVDRPLLLEH